MEFLALLIPLLAVVLIMLLGLVVGKRDKNKKEKFTRRQQWRYQY